MSFPGRTCPVHYELVWLIPSLRDPIAIVVVTTSWKDVHPIAVIAGTVVMPFEQEVVGYEFAFGFSLV